MSFNLNIYDKPIRCVIFIVSLLPAIYLIDGYVNNRLGVNPFATLAHFSGHVTMVFIIITLAITPVRRWLTHLFRKMPSLRWGKRLSDWNVLIRARRMLGLYSFFYACIHVWTYLYLEMDFYWPDVWLEITERYFISFGIITWICLFLLAITSPHFIQRRMHAWWRRLHRLIYPLSILAVLHHYLAVKITDNTPLFYLVIIFILLLHRFLVAYSRRLRRKDDTGMEVFR